MNTSSAPRVALVSGFWGQNIGNAFFNVGGHWILRQIFGEDNVAFIQDQPGYRTFHKQETGNPHNDVELLRFLDVDYIVMQGPLMTVSFEKLWRPTLEALTTRGTKIILLGAAFFKYTEAEFRAVKRFLAEFEPVVISTRDSRSYQVLKSWETDIPLYDGMDSAFFVPKAYKPFNFAVDRYLALNFDRFPEPDIKLSASRIEAATHSFEHRGQWWNLYVPKLQDYFSHKGKAMAYFGHLLDRRKLPTEVDGLMILRPEHRVNPHMTRKIYQHPNAVASDEPWTYFNVYANSEFVLADRVHACVAALAYGREAMLFTPSPRQALFARVGATEIRNRPVKLDMDWLEEERMKEVEWLKAKLG